MIKFFRRIRRKLIDKGNLKRYLVYAIGEILLVVIGILIALQINNRNEGNKSVRKSYEILHEIRENLEFNTVRFQEEIEMEGKVISSIDILKKNITQTKIYNDTLDKHFCLATYWPALTWKSSGYEALKSHGVEIIESKMLRVSIIDLYQISYAEVAEITRLSESNFSSAMLPIWLELIEWEPVDIENPIEEQTAKPIDYSKVVRSEKLRSMLSFLRSNRVASIQLKLKAIKKNAGLIDAINDEFEKE